MTILLNAIKVLIPIFFVMGLGYWAARSKKFDADQVEGLNELVLDYTLPALFFVATVTTTRNELIAEGKFVFAVAAVFVFTFLAVFLLSTRVLHHSIGEAALQASLISFPSAGFIGPPIFKGLFGEASVFSIATAAIVGSITLIPPTVALLEIHQQRKQGSTAGLGEIAGHAVLTTFKKPMVWAPIVGAVLVLLNVDPPDLVDDMLRLVGSATAGVSLFVTGLIIAAYKLEFTPEIIGNTIGKLVLQPLFMAGLVLALAVANPLGREAILICAIPSSVLAPMLAPHYKVYEKESAATVILTAVAMIVTLPVAIFLTRG